MAQDTTPPQDGRIDVDTSHTHSRCEHAALSAPSTNGSDSSPELTHESKTPTKPEAASTPQTSTADCTLPYDHKTSANQTLTFEYAKQAFATAGVAWTMEQSQKLHITDDRGQYTNTSLLASDQCPYTIKIVVFNGDSKTEIIERHTLTGSVLSQLDGAMRLLNKHNAKGIWPTAALRESLVNAVLHRSYTMSGPTVISIFTSRIEIVSLGGLIDGLEVNDLLNGVNQARNTWLAELFASLNVSENCGTGVQRILESYSDSFASPQLRVGPRSLAMVLPAPVKDEETDDSTEGSDKVKTGSSNSIDDFGTAQSTEAADNRHAKRYRFPAAHPYVTDDPAAALAGSRIIGVAPLKTLVLSGSLHASNSTPDPYGTNQVVGGAGPKQAGISKEALPQYTIGSLEEVTLHLFSDQGVQLTRRQVENSLGLNRKETKKLLHSLTDSGKLKRSGKSGDALYTLAKA